MKSVTIALLLIVTYNSYCTTTYSIEIDPSNPFEVRISMRLGETDTLIMHPFCPTYNYPEGWSTFIKPITPGLKYLGNATWKADDKDLQIEYKVDLQFINEQWEVGNEQAGIYIDSTLFVVTRALFIVPLNESDFVVDFDLPKNYKIYTSWNKINSGTGYSVNSREELYNNTVVWGKTEALQIVKSDFTLNLVPLGYDTHVNNLMGEAFDHIIDEFLSIFPGTPPTQYLITFFPFHQNDGEAYATSNAFSLKMEPTEQNRLIWANQLAHELFHFWNGKQLSGPKREDRQWFSEGFTEYMANMTLVRRGIINEAEFYRVIEKTVGLYYYFKLRQFPETSLKEAGHKKSLYRFGVYNGGWCAAFVMDIMIRDLYPEKDLRDFLSYFFQKFGQVGIEYELSDLEREYQNFIVDPNDDFFSKFVEGNDMLPVESHFNKLGLHLDVTPYEGTAFILKDPNATNKHIMLRNRWLFDK